MLVEVLAALLVTAAFVGVVLPFAAQLTAHWWHGQPAVTNADAWMQSIARMSDDMAQAVPLRVVRDGTPDIAFRLTGDAVQFVRPSLGRMAGTDLETVWLEVVPSAAGRALVRRARRYDPGDFLGAAQDGAPATMIIDGPFRMSFAVVDENGQQAGTWTKTDRLPRSVVLLAAATGRIAVPAGIVVMPIAAPGESAQPAPSPAQR